MTSPSELKELISIHSRRLHELKKTQALKGGSVDPAVSIEIEDIETTLDTLKTQLASIEADALQSATGDFDPQRLEGQTTELDRLAITLKSLQKRLEQLEQNAGVVVGKNVSVSGDNNKVFIAGRDISTS